MQAFIIEDKYYTLSEVYQCIKDKQEISLSEIVKEKVQSSNQILEDCIKNGDVIYGVNTGVGKLSQVKISDGEMGLLQKNLIMSHSAGVGENTPNDIVRIMMLLKILSLSRGYSGIRLNISKKY